MPVNELMGVDIMEPQSKALIFSRSSFPGFTTNPDKFIWRFGENRAIYERSVITCWCDSSFAKYYKSCVLFEATLGSFQ